MSGTSKSDAGDISLLEGFLARQPTPVAILDRSVVTSDNLQMPSLIFSNPALTAWIRSVSPGASEEAEDQFRNWATGLPSLGESRAEHRADYFNYKNTSWKLWEVNKKLSILQTISDSEKQDNPRPDPQEEGTSCKRQRTTSAGDHKTTLSTTDIAGSPFPGQSPLTKHQEPESQHDWTQYNIPDAPNYISFLQNFDWEKTDIGPMNDWCSDLRRYVYMIMNNPEPRLLFWGNDFIMLYNEACSQLLGALHPAALGNTGAIGCAPAWPPMRRSLEQIVSTGRPQHDDKFYHPLPRNGVVLEETYWSRTLLPIIDSGGKIIGVMKEFQEKTMEIIHARQAKTLRRAEDMAPVQDLKLFWPQVLETIESNPEDFPFCLLYSNLHNMNQDSREAGTTDESLSESFTLEGLIGISQTHPLAVSQLDITDDSNPLATHFRKGREASEPLLLREEEGFLPELLCTTIPGRGLDSACHTAVLCPISRLDTGGTIGCLLLGLNPQRPYDEHYKGFVKSLIDQLVRSVTSILVPKEQQNLLERTKCAEAQEKMFTRLAELAPVGLALFNEAQIPIWRNQTYDRLSNLQKVPGSPRGYVAPLHPDDRPRCEEAFQRLFEAPASTNYEFRVRGDGSATDGWRHLLSLATSEADEHGKVIRVANFLTDITSHKQNEMLQAEQLRLQQQRLEDALETKRQSENFIDMTCHEIRNPLSSIIQCADSILAALVSNGPRNKEHSPSSQPVIMDATLSAILESAQTIILCAQHQKRIVDDILTLSKLDSKLLLISPSRVKPVSLVEQVLQMFEAELDDSAVKAELSVEDSYRDVGVDYVTLDPARLLQVLINLVTNAIKFTRQEERRQITILLGASLTRPSTSPGKVSYIPPRAAANQTLPESDWGDGDEIFLQFQVCDTGKGLSEDEMRRLFLKFSQGSPKTYSKYGGSGLGLFISKELTELQGGQIGVHSIVGKGSTFTFYIVARKCEPALTGSANICHSTAETETLEIRHMKRKQKNLSASFAYADAAIQGDTKEVSGPRAGSLYSPSDLHILLVEDNLINQKITAKQLRQLGCTVHVANHGLEALQFLARSCFFNTSEQIDPSEAVEDSPAQEQVPLTVILLDQEMPHMDGLQCVRRIREMEHSDKLTRHVPVIAVTANARQEQVAKALEAGMVSMASLMPHRRKNC